MPTPRNNETKDDFLQRCMGWDDMQKYEPDQRYAICQTKWETSKQGKLDKIQKLKSYTDYPESASNNARRALEWAEKNGWGDCGEATGKQRANQLAKREPISRDTIARMASFKRHEQDKDVPYSEGGGGLMWEAWGGTSGIEGGINKLKEIDEKG